jgi:hypothetical protein
MAFWKQIGKAPRKQRHIARRILERIQAELPACGICPRTVRPYVHDHSALGFVRAGQLHAAELRLGGEA